MRILYTFSLLLIFSISYGQYSFTDDVRLESTDVKNQQSTGTCWSYATSSFLESELIREDGTPMDLSEMYVVRKIYENKAQNFILRQGKAQFGQGSLAHDLLKIVGQEGILPQSAYPGKPNGEDRYDHTELENVLKGYLSGVLATPRKTDLWKKGVSAILDVYLGTVPETIMHNGQKMNPKEFAKAIGIETGEYVSLTSFSHHPYNERFVLEIPDNYSNGQYYNVELDEMMSIIDFGIKAGYSIVWDGDVSEKGFSAKDGLAILPMKPGRKDLFKNTGAEIQVNQKNRQVEFETLRTTDDHLMHIVGISTDQKGNKYYIIKNSWGLLSDYKGYLYMSESYMRMKTVGISLNQNALPKASAQKILAIAK